MSRNWKRIGSLEAMAVLILFAGFATALVGRVEAKTPPALRGPVATVGDRSVEALDIQYAAQSLGIDPPRGMTAKAWRRTLLDRCVDRELLAIEAEHLGLPDDPAVWRRINAREYELLMGSLQKQVLEPWVTPSPAEFDSIKNAGRYRWLDLHYLFIFDDDAARPRAEIAARIANHARRGARFDSLAKIYSGHPPTAAKGGHYGPIMVRELLAQAQDSIQSAKPGDVFGPYAGPYGHDIYKIGGWIEVGDDSLNRILMDERRNQMFSSYYSRVLKQYHYTADSANMAQATAVLKRERPNSILASLRPDGTRPSLGVRPAIGILARGDGVAVTIEDIIRIARRDESKDDLIPIHGLLEMGNLAISSVLQGLIVRDARAKGLDKDPEIARRLRLIRDQVATRAMVERARPRDPDPATLRAYIEKHASRYHRPAARTARVAMFSNADSARSVFRAWNGIGFPSDSSLRVRRFQIRDRAKFGALFPNQVATLSVPEGINDPLSLSLRALAPGQFAPVTETVQGWAVAMMTGREAAAPLSPEEAAPLALNDWRMEKENQVVGDLLERLRAKTPVAVFPARLEAVRLAAAKPSTTPLGKQAAR